MKVGFLTEGGGGVGLGHISRCQSLADAFEELNYQCKFIINGNNSLKKNIRYKTIRIIQPIIRQTGTNRFRHSHRRIVLWTHPITPESTNAIFSKILLLATAIILPMLPAGL